MVRYTLLLLFVLIQLQGSAQQAPTKLQRPKLVVGLVVDQMRWDYLYRYYDRYAEDGGFKRLLNNGFSCEQTYIPYVPTITACGHSSIYTGSVPAINGITGNDWWDYKYNKIMYCTQDDSVRTIGSANESGKMSPRNLKATTIGDELRLATNFKSKVVGIALKDRGAILPAGQSGNAAYWYDSKTGNWVSSSYYMNELPKWVTTLNDSKLADKYYEQDWNTLYPVNTYTESGPDDATYETGALGGRTFPHNLKQFAGKNYGILPVTPYGNTMTFEMAKAAINGEQLGATGTDMLAVSLSSPDYIGHNFGPNSVEAEDGFLRLDKDLGAFLDFLDSKYGKGSYLLFLSADHGAANAPGYLTEKKIASGGLDLEAMATEANNAVKERFKINNSIIGAFNSQVYLDRNAISAGKTDRSVLVNFIAGYLAEKPGISRAFSIEDLSAITLNSKIKNAVANGYYPSRSGDIQLVFEPGYIEGFVKAGTTHGSWNPYDSHIPLLWYGWNIRPGKTNRQTSMTDIAVTIASLLEIQPPSGSIGTVIEEVKK